MMPRLLDQYLVTSVDGRSRLALSPDYAESLEGDWVALELPAPGAAFMERDAFAFLSTDRAAHEFRAPFAFRVLAVNERVREHPGVAQLSPTGAGWLIEIEPLEGQAIV